jgi:HAD superfamily hydrolase (TIGR01509 family)
MIFFDAGGTLVLQDHAEAGRRLGIQIDADAAFEAHYRAMFEFSSMKRAGSPATWEWWQERYYGFVGHPDPSTAGPALDNGRGLWSHPIPGVREAIRQISRSDFRVAVISNSDGSVTESLVRAGFVDLFEVILDSAVVGAAKPDREIFDLACETVGVDPAECWYVGDSEYHDVDGARAAGFAGAWLVDPLGLGSAENAIGSVAELPHML